MEGFRANATRDGPRRWARALGGRVAPVHALEPLCLWRSFRSCGTPACGASRWRPCGCITWTASGACVACPSRAARRGTSPSPQWSCNSCTCTSSACSRHRWAPWDRTPRCSGRRAPWGAPMVRTARALPGPPLAQASQRLKHAAQRARASPGSTSLPRPQPPRALDQTAAEPELKTLVHPPPSSPTTTLADALVADYEADRGS